MRARMKAALWRGLVDLAGISLCSAVTWWALSGLAPALGFWRVRKAASAIIPTPELREAVERLLADAVDDIAAVEAFGVPGDAATIRRYVALVRAAFKETDNA